jgi:hypothetical protein
MPLNCIVNVSQLHLVIHLSSFWSLTKLFLSWLSILRLNRVDGAGALPFGMLHHLKSASLMVSWHCSAFLGTRMFLFSSFAHFVLPAAS